MSTHILKRALSLGLLTLCTSSFAGIYITKTLTATGESGGPGSCSTWATQGMPEIAELDASNEVRRESLTYMSAWTLGDVHTTTASCKWMRGTPCNGGYQYCTATSTRVLTRYLNEDMDEKFFQHLWDNHSKKLSLDESIAIAKAVKYQEISGELYKALIAVAPAATYALDAAKKAAAGLLDADYLLALTKVYTLVHSTANNQWAPVHYALLAKDQTIDADFFLRLATSAVGRSDNGVEGIGGLLKVATLAAEGKIDPAIYLEVRKSVKKGTDDYQQAGVVATAVVDQEIDGEFYKSIRKGPASGEDTHEDAFHASTLAKQGKLDSACYLKERQGPAFGKLSFKDALKKCKVRSRSR